MNSQHGDEFEKSDVEINQQNVKFILMDGFEYSFSRMLGGAQKWKCTNKSCYAYFKILDNLLLPGVMTHTHPREDDASCRDASHTVVQREASPEQQAHSPVLQRSEVPGGQRTCPSQAKRDPSLSWNHPSRWDSSGRGVKKVKLPNGKTVMRLASAASPSSGFMSDQESAAAFLLAASPTKSKTPSPKSPKLSEVGPPLTPPLSRNSSSHDSYPSSPLPPIIDLVDTRCRPLSLPPDSNTHFVNPTNSLPPAQVPPAKQSTSSSSRFNHNTKKLSKLAKYKEYEDQIMQLDNEKFGYAVTSLLSELPPKTAEDIRYEIATMLYAAVEGREN